MKVILLEDVKALGKKGEIVDVSDGYARNFILPRKKGIEASTGNLNDLKLQKANEAKVAKENLENARTLAEELKSKPVTIKIRVGEGGKAFGAVGNKEISQAIKDQYGFDVDKKKIVVEPIKELGIHTVKIKLHKDVAAELQVNVVEG